MKRPRTLPQSLPSLRHIFVFLRPHLRRHWRLLVGSVLTLLAEVVLSTLEPWPLKFIFDHVLGSKRRSGSVVAAFVEGWAPATIVTVSALAIIVICGLRSYADYLSTVGFARVANRILAQIRAQVYLHLQTLSLSFHTRARGGDLLLRVMADVNQLRDVAVTAALPLCADGLVLVGMVGVMFWLHWKLAVVALATLPGFWLWTSRQAGPIRNAARKQRQRESAMAATAAEAITAIKLIQALSLERRFAESFLRRNQEGQKQDVKTVRLTAGLARSVSFLTTTSTALVLWYGARLVIRQELTPGELLVFVTYLRNAFRPVRDFAKYTGRLVKASAAGERVLHLLEQVPEVQELPGAAPAPALSGRVELRDVSFAYDPRRRVLDRVNLIIEPGQHVAVVGRSGAGKSTLASLLLRLHDPTQGQILIDGHDIRDFTLASLRAQISVVLQESFLFAASIRENIAYGATETSPEAVEAAARLAGAHEFISALLQGYDTAVGERGATLSGGQRQRIAIARAAIRQAPILIFDEATSELDEENERIVLESLQRVSHGRTTFWITHDLRLASRADLILYLDGGKSREVGSHDELMQTGGRYASLFTLQNGDVNSVASGFPRSVGP
jgi:ATP-binding cassette subfamily B protein